MASRLGYTPEIATAVVLNDAQTDIAEDCKPYASAKRVLHNDAGYVRLTCQHFRALGLSPAFAIFVGLGLFTDRNRIRTLVIFANKLRDNDFPADDTIMSIIREWVVMYPSDRKEHEAEFAARAVKVQIRSIKEMLAICALKVLGAQNRTEQDRIDKLEEERQQAWHKLAKMSKKDLPDVPAYEFPHAHRLLLDGEDDLETVNRILVMNRYFDQTKGKLHYNWCVPHVGFKLVLDPVVPDFMKYNG